MAGPSGRSTMNIIQWNAGSLEPKLRNLELILSREKIHLAFISETWLSEEDTIRISQYNIFRADREDSYGGVCAITHKSVKITQASHSIRNSEIETLVLKVLNVTGLKNIIIIYCPPSARTTQQDWSHIFELYTSETIIVGDMNGHHTLWSGKNDKRGEYIYQAMFDNDYICLNDGNHTRIRMVNGVLQQSSPDISFASTDIATNFSWSSTNETLGSDHTLIKIRMGFEKSGIHIKKRNFKEAHWDQYTEMLEETFESFSLSGDTQNCYDSFIGAIQSAADSTIPWTKISEDPDTHFKPKPYWNSELSKVIAERRLALAKVRRNPTPDNYKTYKEKLEQAAAHTKRARFEGWAEFCSSVDHETSSADMWRKMRWMKGQTSRNAAVDPSVAENLLHSLTPDSVEEPLPTLSMLPQSILENSVTLAELENCLKRRDTSPGADNISYSMLYRLPTNAKKLLVKLYNMILDTGELPNQWREILIVPIPKPGRDPNLASSLRPISLMSCPCKIFHLILLKRMEWYMERGNFFPSSTIGFRRAKSSLDCLTNLVSSIQIGFANSNPTVACFLDVSDAYNNVNIVSLIKILGEIGIGHKICLYLWNFLSNRQCKIVVNNNTFVRKLSRGLAQGDPMSPLLFNIVTKDLSRNMFNVNFSQYADDFVIYKTVQDRNINSTISDLNNSMGVMVNLLDNIGLDLSEKKSNMCVFTRSRKHLNYNNVYINGAPIKIINKVKYLGLWLDSSLRWSAHINETCEKCYKHLNVLKVLAGSGWGVHPKHLRRLYISLIRSRLDYGSFLYGNSAETHLKKLTMLQNRALRVCGSFIRSTPIHVMESELSLPPLFVRRFWLGCRYWLRNASLSNNEIVTQLNEMSSLKQHWRERNAPLLIEINEKLKHKDLFETPKLGMYLLDIWVSYIDIKACIRLEIEGLLAAKRNYDSIQLKALTLKDLNTRYPDHYRLYTDGSKGSVGVGAAVFDPQTDASIVLKLNKKVSIMRAELVAIHAALSYIQERSVTRAVILTDSKSALQHLAQCASGSRGADVAYEILRIVYETSVQLQWVPSHIGLRGNERADQLANDAVCSGRDVVCKPYASELLRDVRSMCYVKWQKHFIDCSTEKGIWYRTIQNLPNTVPWFDDAGLSREALVTAFRLRSGHIPLNYFYHLMGKKDSPNCISCGKTEDLLHLLVECDQNKDLREKLFQQNLYGGGIGCLLADPSSDAARLLYKFCAVSLKNRRS